MLYYFLISLLYQCQRIYCYGFYGHDLIAKHVWNQLNNQTISWFCSVYEICNVTDFQTLSALPDLLKHDDRFIKYFSLHFFNNLMDNPPSHCEIDVIGAFNQSEPNLLRAIKVLSEKLTQNDLSFTEMAYFVHLLADIHQPFHITAFDRGGMGRQLCSTENNTCWSLHALWDAEILKLIMHKNSHNEGGNNSSFNLEKWCLELNAYICKLYEFPENYSIEQYVEKYKTISLYFVNMAVGNIAKILNSMPITKASPYTQMASFSSAVDFDREISNIISEIGKTSCINSELTDRFNILQKQFKVKSSFLSGYQLKQLREKVSKLSVFFEIEITANSANLSDIVEIISPTESLAEIQLSNKTGINVDDRRTLISSMKDKMETIIVSGDVLIENLYNSTIQLKGNITSLRIKDISESSVDIQDMCDGTIYIENVKSSKLIISGDQIRIHDSQDSDIKLFARTSCILEDCKKLRFSPNILAAKKANILGTDSYWKCVQDFCFNDENSYTYV